LDVLKQTVASAGKKKGQQPMTEALDYVYKN